ncbi:hypothetical protein [Sphingobacterium sp. LRF_L2]|uniref:hypothetical protein n=1 Tax=Sphingobacterium sp. LRF_L2 TaxID=3369421 RepID=UPI003F61D6C4
MLCYNWALIKHFFISNSRHGTHSPFVYGLTENVIYTHDYKAAPVEFPFDFSACYKFLLRDLLSFLNIRSIAYFPFSENNEALWADLGTVSEEEIIEAVRAGKIVVIHEPTKSKKKWDRLIHNPAVVVSINLFHFGVLMQRKGQQKENFVLRYPYWITREKETS